MAIFECEIKLNRRIISNSNTLKNKVEIIRYIDCQKKGYLER